MILLAMPVDQEQLHRAAEALAAAEAIMFAAHAESEMEESTGVRRDGGVPPALAARGGTVADLDSPGWFERDPAQAWGHYGEEIERARGLPAPADLVLLRRLAGKKARGVFCFTSCIDSRFQRAGFAEEQIVECHGSLEHLQCVKPCCAATWPAATDLRLEVDAETLRAGRPPRCVRCDGPARPNVLFTSDQAWSFGRTLAQQVRYRAWLGSLARGKFAVVELGMGPPESAVRQAAEQLAAAARVPLVGIHPREREMPPAMIPLVGEVPDVLRELAAAMGEA